MTNYKVLKITDKKVIEELITYDEFKLLESCNLESLKIEIDYEEKKSFINLEDIIVFIDYYKTSKLLNDGNF